MATWTEAEIQRYIDDADEKNKTGVRLTICAILTSRVGIRPGPGESHKSQA